MATTPSIARQLDLLQPGPALLARERRPKSPPPLGTHTTMCRCAFVGVQGHLLARASLQPGCTTFAARARAPLLLPAAPPPLALASQGHRPAAASSPYVIGAV